jgi:Na+-transporting methylmalonyl-CoA/oxaloacetate decarboxylase gamma subunit
VEQSKNMRKLLYCTLIMITLIWFLGSLVGQNFPDSPKTSPEKTAASAKYAAEMEQVSKAKKFVRAIKEMMRNPDSFKVEHIYVTADGAYCVTYRSQNGFGGMNQGAGVLTPDFKESKIDGMENFKKLWKRYCTSSGGREITDYFQLF